MKISRNILLYFFFFSVLNQQLHHLSSDSFSIMFLDSNKSGIPVFLDQKVAVASSFGFFESVLSPGRKASFLLSFAAPKVKGESEGPGKCGKSLEGKFDKV